MRTIVTRCTVVVLLMALARVSYAGDHLTLPMFGPANHLVGATEPALKGAFEPSVRARAVIVPAFVASFAVGIKEAAGQYSLFYIELTDALDKPVVEGSVSEPIRVAVQCKLNVDSTLATDLIGVWRKVLSNAKTSGGPEGADGVVSYYSMTIDGQTLAAEAWGPIESSEAGRMMSITFAIADACKTKDKKFLANIKALVAQLNAG